MHKTLRWLATTLAIAVSVGACASVGGTGAGTSPSGNVGPTPGSTEQWPVKTREHVDLWLHGFAMVEEDSSLVPFFRRGYKSDLAAVKSRSNIVTQLDANNAKLHARFALNPQLINAQFLPFYFDTFDEMATAMDLFYRADGDPRQAGSQQNAETIALIAGYFPTQADRDWARLFMQSLRDEDTRFYKSYWDQQQRDRAPVLSAVTSLWQNTYRARFQTFLNNTSQTAGEIYLSLPLDGEGRTLSAGKRQNASAVTFPVRSSDAAESIYVLAHELVSTLVATAVNDNITPNDRRNGVADRYIAAGTVRAGAMLLQKVAPELVSGYTQYYLRSANRSSGTLTTVFALPDGIRDAISKQLDVVLGGI
ncbi:MAG TPA: hypothetical protein VNC11_01770 [Gemmatimonadaceae bacterium]|nr:hypothetical protein [Gemmatimonadaceae bacterium]